MSVLLLSNISIVPRVGTECLLDTAVFYNLWCFTTVSITIWRVQKHFYIAVLCNATQVSRDYVRGSTELSFSDAPKKKFRLDDERNFRYKLNFALEQRLSGVALLNAQDDDVERLCCRGNLTSQCPYPFSRLMAQKWPDDASFDEPTDVPLIDLTAEEEDELPELINQTPNVPV